MREHLFEHINSEGLTVTLRNVSITLLDKTEDKDSKREKMTGLEHSRPMYHLTLKTASDQFYTKL